MIHKIGERINRYRKENNMSQEEFGGILNVSRQAISKWENGESLPDVYNAIAIARLFHVSLDELLLGSTGGSTSKHVLRDAKNAYKKYSLRGRVFGLIATICLAPPMIVMDALGVENPYFGIGAVTGIILFALFMFFTVHNFIKSHDYKEEMNYINSIEMKKYEIETEKDS